MLLFITLSKTLLKTIKFIKLLCKISNQIFYLLKQNFSTCEAYWSKPKVSHHLLDFTIQFKMGHLILENYICSCVCNSLKELTFTWNSPFKRFWSNEIENNNSSVYILEVKCALVENFTLITELSFLFYYIEIHFIFMLQNYNLVNTLNQIFRYS